MKKILLGVFLAALAAGAWIWHARHSSGDSPEEQLAPTAEVRVSLLRMQPISRTLSAFGVVEAGPAGARAITLAYDCVVKSVAAAAGTSVAPGGLIMEVSPTADAQLQLDFAQSAAALAEKSLSATQQRYDLRLATNQDLLAAQQAEDDARIKLASYQNRMAGNADRITASDAGVVTKLDWQPGATIPAGTVLAVISSWGQLEAHLMVEAADAGAIHAGQTVTLISANRPNAEPVSGAVRRVGASVDAASGAVEVSVPLPPDAKWYPGEHVQGAIELQRKTTLVASRSAVLPDDGQQVLYTVKDHKAVRHPVQIGITSADSVEVIDPDLHAGDTVVTQGNYELEDGMAVQVESPEATAAAARDDNSPGTKP